MVRLDCRSIEPTEHGFLQELAGAVGGEAATAEQAAVIETVHGTGYRLRRS